MTTIKPVPSLSPKGYLTSITEKLDALMAHFYASDANQDHIHSGTISNLSIIVKEAGHNIPKFKADLQRTLEDYLGRMFDRVSVQVDDDIDTNDSNRVTVSYGIEVSQAGVRYDVAHQLSLVDGKFEKITRLNNTGRIR